MPKKSTLIWLIILGVLLLTCLPLLKFGFFDVHDPTHLGRVYLLRETLMDGQIPAVWANTANLGYGYPLFHFYAPAFYYLVGFMGIFTPTLLTALKLSLILISLSGGIGMYYLMKRYGHLVGLLSAVSFLLVPYRAIGLFVRGSYAELFAIMLLPWLFWAWRSLNPRRVGVTSVITALFLLSHNLIPLLVAPFLMVWTLLYQGKHLRRVVITAMLSLLLASFYLLPLIFERDFVQVDALSRLTNYSLHFVSPSQLWDSVWGFGGSAPGLEDGISFKIGKLHLILAGLGVIVGLRHKKAQTLALFAGVTLLFSVIMTTSFSRILWDNIFVLQVIQFPWRFLALISLAVSVLAGLSVTLFKSTQLRTLYTILTISLLLFFNLKYFSPQAQKPYSDQEFTNTTFLQNELAAKVPEFLPVWVSSFPESQAPSLPTSQEGPGTFVLPRTYYPTWVATDNGMPLALRPSQDGLIEFDLLDDSHEIVITQSHTLLESIASFISLITLFVVGYLYVKSR